MCSASSECKCKCACWVTYTPDECEYRLVMFDNDGGKLQGVELTRDEYIAVKEQLAHSRGLLDSSGPGAEVK